MKTIEDLNWSDFTTNSPHECASIMFDNNYGVSVIKWDKIFGGTYELCTLYNKQPISHEITSNDVKRVNTHAEVNEIMKQIQELKG